MTPDLPHQVTDLLNDWLPANGHRTRPAMTLSTVGETGTPDVRTVLLDSFDAEGFVFHTESLTRKVADLLANPKVALGFLLADPLRQLTVQGIAVRQAEEEARADFASVSRNRQILAWLNTNDFVELDENERRDRWTRFAQDNPEGSIQAPPGWAGYRVVPERLTFWYDSTDCGAHRVEYSRTESQWVRSVLPG